MIDIVATGPGLPSGLPHIPLTRAATLPRDRWRVWHARRNTEMALGLILRRVLAAALPAAVHLGRAARPYRLYPLADPSAGRADRDLAPGRQLS